MKQLAERGAVHPRTGPHHGELEDADEQRIGHVLGTALELEVHHQPLLREPFEGTLELDPLVAGGAGDPVKRGETVRHADEDLGLVGRIKFLQDRTHGLVPRRPYREAIDLRAQLAVNVLSDQVSHASELLSATYSTASSQFSSVCLMRPRNFSATAPSMTR